MPRIPNKEDEDIKREKNVYIFLLKLVNITTSPLGDIEDLKEANITKKWGYTGNDAGRKFIERVLKGLKGEGKLPNLPLSRLVDILEGIENYWKEERDTNKSIPNSLKNLDKIRAIKKYCELSREEKQRLGFSIDFKTYIQENFINLSDNNVQSTKASFGIVKQEKYIDISEDIKPKNQKIEQEEAIVTLIKTKYINNLIKEVIQNEFSENWLNNNPGIVEEIQKKVKDEITVIAIKSGLEIARYNLHQLIPKNSEQSLKNFEEAYKKQWESQLFDKLIKNLTVNIIKSKIVTDKIPVTFRYLEIQKIGPLPFEDENSLINDKLLSLDPDKIATEEAFEIFQKNNGYRVIIHFRLTLEEKEENSKQNKKIDFFEEVSGISSILSLVRKALNRALLWDIDCLKEYFPVMQEVYVEDKFFGGDSLATVLSKSRGRLINIDDLKGLLKEEKTEDNNQNNTFVPLNFNSYIEGSDIVQSDYLGFDLIEAIAKSGFLARLRLIKETGIDPKSYRNDLKRRIEQNKNLLQGKKYLQSYPFSLLAMENHLNKTIIDHYRKEELQQWSKIAYQAQLFIIEAYLDEGLVKTAGKLLNELEKHDEKNCLTHLLKANYYLCQAQYNLLCHEDEREDIREKNQLIQACDDYLNKAEKELQQRLLEFFRIGEIAQGHLSPFYSYWTKIYLVKARLQLFFPKFLKNSLLQLQLPLLSLGRARVYYAPRDGNSYLYAKASLYQSLCYLMEAYTHQDNIKELSHQDCIDWAKKLIDQALLNYQDISQECYRDYTDNLFFDEQNQEKYGSLKIERPPFLNLIPPGESIEDTESNNEKNNSNLEVKVYKISCKLIKRNFTFQLGEDQSLKAPIDLFGQHSSLYFLALGMVKLCDNYDNYSEEELLDNLKDAYNYFVCSWAIAKGCSQLETDGKGEVCKLKRNFSELKIGNTKIEDKFNVSKLASVYFHRISEWMDLAKIFMAVCWSIIARQVSDTKPDFSVVEAILDEGGDVFSEIPHDFARGKFVSEQQKYNRHLESAFKRIKDYLRNDLEQFSNINPQESLLDLRYRMLENVFLRLRGD